MTATEQDIEIWSGESKTIDPSPLTEEDTDEIVDLAGATLRWVIVNRVNDEVLVTKELGDGITVRDEQNGEWEINLVSADTEDLEGSYYHEARVVDGDGNESVVSVGEFVIKDGYA